MMKMNSNNIIDACELPKDVFLGASILSVIGKEEIVIENFKNIIEYEETYILIQCKNYRLKIEGTKISIVLYTKEELRIKGEISDIKFL